MSANARCPRISGIVLALLPPAALIIARPANGISQQLILSADVGKTTFFEGEPVYLLVRLQNLGTDTAWTASSDVFDRPAQRRDERRSLRRQDVLALMGVTGAGGAEARGGAAVVVRTGDR